MRLMVTNHVGKVTKWNFDVPLQHLLVKSLLFLDQFEENKIMLSSVKRKIEFFQLPALWMQECDKKSIVLAVVLVQAWSHYFQNLLQGCVSMARIVHCICSLSCWGCQVCISCSWFRNNEVLLKHFPCTSRQLLAIKYTNEFKQDRLFVGLQREGCT